MIRRYRIEIRELNSSNKQIVSLVELLCSVEYAIASMRWYTTDTSPQGSVAALSLFLSHTGEALHKYQAYVNKGLISKSSLWTQETQQSWDYLQTDEVDTIKIKLLKMIRDKSTFHIDDKIIKKFLDNRTIEYDDVNVIWETNNDGRGGHSPIAALVIADSIMIATYGEDRNITGLGEKACMIFGAIRDVVLESLADFGLELMEKENK